MPLQDANLEMDPSDISDMDDKVTPVTEHEPDPAASSPATGETDTELLSVARDAIDKERGKSETASPADGADKDPDTDADADDAPKQDDENYSDVPFHKHPRFQQLLRERNTAQQDAVRYQNVENFLAENGLSAGEASDALIIASNMRRNPHKAWEMLKPLVTNLLIATGEILPDDLKQRVAGGELSVEAAKEISVARSKSSSVEREREFEVTQRDNTERTNLIRSLKDAAQNWEQDRRIKDPNYADKEVAIRKEILFLQSTEGKPTTPQGVRAQLKKAYDAVNQNFRPANPTPNPRPAVNPVRGGQVAGNQNPDPKQMSTLDIVRAGRGR